MNTNLELVEQTTTEGFRYLNKQTGSVVGTIMMKHGVWKVNSFDFFNGSPFSFKSLAAAKHFLAAFATEAWEEESMEMAIRNIQF